MKLQAAGAIALAALVSASSPAPRMDGPYPPAPNGMPPPPSGPPPGPPPPGPPPGLICPTGAIIIPTAVVYPLSIQTYIGSNTVFNINGNANITINNAPTTINTIISGTSTVYSTVTTTTTVTTGTGTGTGTASSSGSGPTGTNLANNIILGINGGAGTKVKRQSLNGRFLGPTANYVTGCANAAQFQLRNGQLFDASGRQFSTSPGTASNYFQTSGSVGTISTTFATDGGFQWSNPAFTNGAATFCSGLDGRVRAVFSGAVPLGCTPLTFTAFLASSCNGANGTSSTTGSTSPTSPASSGASGASSAPTSGGSSTSPAAATTNAVLSANVPSASKMAKEKRQSTVQYLKSDGTLTSDKSQAAVIGVTSDGRCVLNGVSYSTTPTTSNQIFTPGSGGSILTTFNFPASGGTFTWTNQTFTYQGNGQAAFALVGNTVYAAFQSLPPGAVLLTLGASPVPSGGIPSSTSAASTASSSTASGSSTSAAGSSTTSSSPTTSSTSTTTQASAGITPTAKVKRYNVPHARVRHA